MKKSDAKYCYVKSSYYDSYLRGRHYSGYTNKTIYTNNPNALLKHDGQLNMYYTGLHTKNDLRKAGLDKNKIELLFRNLQTNKNFYYQKIENYKRRNG